MTRPYQSATALLASWCLILVSVRDGRAYQDAPPSSQPLPQALQKNPEELQQLVAPIALYPDALVAQILTAATYPEELVEAKKWMDQNKGLPADKLGPEVDRQSWDPSVKALTQFPAVLANMNQNLAWTSELGDAYLNQQQELSKAIQDMREHAKKVGNLKTTPQQTVSDKGKTIVIEPAAPDVVYVPQYDPWLVYGYPLVVFPGWYPYPGLYWDSPGIGFGLGFGIGLFSGFGWGWHGWGFDWHHGGKAIFHHTAYISHSRTIVNRGNARSNFRNRSAAGRDQFRGNPRARSGMRSGAFSGFSHGGIAKGNAFRGQSSFGGFHGGGGGFHGGGGRRR